VVGIFYHWTDALQAGLEVRLLENLSWFGSIFNSYVQTINICMYVFISTELTALTTSANLSFFIVNFHLVAARLIWGPKMGWFNATKVDVRG
jgi:hypothetical protein